MVEVDRAMIEDFEIDLVRMMENAGRNLADLARRRFLDRDPRGAEVVVLAGAGGNGGGALVAARRLSNWGAAVHVQLARVRDELSPVAAQQLAILENIGVATSGPGGDPPAQAELIEWANAVASPVLSLDTPSGLDVTTGVLYRPALVATATMTLALPKEGLRSDQARAAVGELYLADISVPPALYAAPPLALAVGPIFAESDVVRIG
jgi:NAD(P)H-hydrate epimerase